MGSFCPLHGKFAPVAGSRRGPSRLLRFLDYPSWSILRLPLTWLPDVPNRHAHYGQFEPDLLQTLAVVLTSTLTF
jgi:hypothetical protein